jgi:hypothetical protein
MSSIGTREATAIAPVAAVERVASHTWRVLAKLVIELPTPDSVVPIHRRRNAALSRRGVMSVRSLTGPI